MKPLVVVTGASGGIGRASVQALAARGLDVVATLRRPQPDVPLDGAAFQVPLDLADPAGVERAAAEIRALGRPLRALVNNAGLSRAGALEDLPLETIREVLEVNLIGPLALTRRLLPGLREGRGRVVNVGSGEGFLATPLNAPYCMAKHALEALSASLRQELAGSGVRVSVVSPGQTETRILERARAEFAGLEERASPPYRSLVAARGRMAERRGAAPEPVARAIARAVTDPRPRSRYFVGADSRGAFLLGRLLPHALRRLVYRHGLGFPEA